MIENCIGVLPLPLGLGLGFRVNDKHYTVPMALEEPSVIAACSVMAKLVITYIFMTCY
jgi:hydroxymethylglutaryl-CoA reductase